MEPTRNKKTTAGSCPICGKPRQAEYRPFCSKRCADIDLARWLDGAYAIPAVELDDPERDAGEGGSPDGRETEH